jgi:hypothetical protein
MNERIRELIQQAGSDTSGKWLGLDHAEKLVELVVLECADVVEKNLYKNIGWNTSRAVRRHFGLGPEE